MYTAGPPGGMEAQEGTWVQETGYKEAMNKLDPRVS